MLLSRVDFDEIKILIIQTGITLLFFTTLVVASNQDVRNNVSDILVPVNHIGNKKQNKTFCF